LSKYIAIPFEYKLNKVGTDLYSFKKEKALFLLLLLTIVLLLGHDFFLNNIIKISPTSHQNVNLYNDSINGGNTSTTLFDSTKMYKWQCELSKGNTNYPYCGFEINLGASISEGIDLSDYKFIKIWLNYQGEAKTIRVTLRNFNSEYSNAKDKVSTKFHQLDIPTNHLKAGKEVSLASFSVPTWWKLDLKVPINLDGPELNNIVFIDVQTGSDISEGLQQFELQKIEIHGQWLATETWYFSILFCWLLIGASILIIRLLTLNKTIKRSNQREQELLQMNSVLDKRAKKLLKISKKDKLTGALNRQGIEDAISIGILDWKKESKPLSIIMLDIDHFKKINDTHGHDVGDTVLTSLTKLVKTNIRATDRFARWGGEEFVLVCRNTSLDAAFQIAEDLRERIANACIIDNIKVTASFGVSDMQNDGSVKVLFKQADEALYRAKNSGRNKVKLRSLNE